MKYFVRSPWWLQKLFSNRIWEIKSEGKKIYLTFDDGPHPVHTPFVLDELSKYNAKATFFCIGKNVDLYPEIYKRILTEGHKVGNHTQQHLNGWDTDDKTYLENVYVAAERIDSDLFRPPYGRLKKFQEKVLIASKYKFKIIMWTVLSGDFDETIPAKQCLENVLLKMKAGSIIVFHDSEKASERMRYALPKLLATLKEQNFDTDIILG
jgi:peptidoglycan-N-acetylglucosamine deacetylase